MKPVNPAVSAELARSMLAYDAESGELRWQLDVPSPNRRGGQVAGRLRADGYRDVRIAGHLVLSHRLVWLLHHGQWPEREIDHINGDKADNRVANLREADRATNMQNQRRAKAQNKTGFLGVHKIGSGYCAQITINRRQTHIGVYATAEQAHSAYVTAKRSAHEGNTL